MPANQHPFVPYRFCPGWAYHKDSNPARWNCFQIFTSPPRFFGKALPRRSGNHNSDFLHLLSHVHDIRIVLGDKRARVAKPLLRGAEIPRLGVELGGVEVPEAVEPPP